MGDGHVLIADGEILAGGKFVVERSSMINWEPPFENETLSVSDIVRIEEQVLEKTTDKSVRILFE